MRLAGIDGCKGGWVAVVTDGDDLSSARLCLADTLSDLMIGQAVDFAIVDMPIGLSNGPDPRDVETGMRLLLRGKTSSVFSTPCRQALFEFDYFEASAINRDVLARGLTKQTFMLFPKLREVDQTVRMLGQDRIREGHPEVSFAVLSGAPVLSKKRTPVGAADRVAILARHGLEAGPLLAAKPKAMCATDDVLDAAALLLSAQRFARRHRITIPPTPQRDSAGLEMSVIA